MILLEPQLWIASVLLEDDESELLEIFNLLFTAVAQNTW